MHISVIGAGQLGATLAAWCAESGHDVALTSRHPERLGYLVTQMGSHAHAMPVADAAAFGDVVLFTPNWESAKEALDLSADGLAGKVVIDATNPVDQGEETGLETLMHWAPEAHWVKAFNTLPPEVLARRRGNDPLLAEFISTDLKDARATASKIIRDLGFAPVYAGGAETARLTETGGPLQLHEIDVFHATDALAEALAVTT
ncbi:NADPH-dependent F420 reductase [Micromonosporaceae bacterium Da 78-11]